MVLFRTKEAEFDELKSRVSKHLMVIAEKDGKIEQMRDQLS